MSVVKIRSSSISTIIDCRLRGLSIMLGLVKALPSTAPATIGSAVHDGTAVYDQAKLDGDIITPNDAAGVVVDYLKDHNDDTRWGKITPKEAERRALGVYTRYCVDIAPKMKYEAVELPLTPMILDVNGIEIELTGTLDRVYTHCDEAIFDKNYEPGRGILDVKTGINACSAKPEKHLPQIGTYELLQEHTTGRPITLPGLIGALQTSREYLVDIKPVYNARTVLLGDGETKGLLEYIARDIKSGDWEGNTSSWLCSENYCPLYNNCFYRGKL